MKFLFSIVVFAASLGSLCAQTKPTFLDSIFYNIPFKADLRTTCELLNKNKIFALANVDTLTPNFHTIEYTVKIKSVIPNKASKISFRKWPFKMSVDGKTPSGCGKYSSGIMFSYNKQGAAEKDFKRIYTFLQGRLKAKSIITLKEKNFIYGYEFCMSDNEYCNHVVLTFSQQESSGFVEVAYR